MKKSLIAFAVFSAFASVASAQSSVVLYGVIDASVAYKTNQNVNGSKQTAMESSNFSSSRFGLKGTEGLTDGLKANFKLEASIAPDVGTAGSTTSTTSTLFDRNATVGLSGDFGSVDLGRQTTFAEDTVALVDPMNAAHSSTNPNKVLGALGNASLYSNFGTNKSGSAARQNNSIKYTLPKVLGGLTFGAMYGFGEVTGDTLASSYAGGSAVFAQDGLTAVFTYAQLKDPTNGSTLRSYTGGGKFVVGKDFAVKVTYAENEVNTTKRDISVFGVGVDYSPTEQTTLTAAYYANRRSGDMPVKGKADQYVMMAKYAFSKRTSAYASFSYAKAGSKAAVDQELGLFIGAGQKTATRTAVGIVHSF